MSPELPSGWNSIEQEYDGKVLPQNLELEVLITLDLNLIWANEAELGFYSMNPELKIKIWILMQPLILQI